MRPDRAIVKRAIVDAGNNLRLASSLLGCTRQTLYTWIYQLGLERFAGVRMDTRTELDQRERMDARPRKEKKSGVYSAETPRPNLVLVQEAATVDLPIQATLKVRESLWKRVKIEAIRKNTTVGALVETMLESALLPEKKANTNGAKK